MSWINERIDVIKLKTLAGKGLFSEIYKYRKYLTKDTDKVIRNKIGLITASIAREANYFHSLEFFEVSNIIYGVNIQELKDIYEEQVKYLYELDDYLKLIYLPSECQWKIKEIIKKLLSDDETYLNELYNLRSLS